MTPTGTIFTIACSATAIGVVAVTEGTPAENWTILGLLAAVVLGIGSRMVMSLDKNTAATNAMSGAIDRSSAVAQNLVTELRTLITQQTEAHADYATARERAVADLKEHIGDALREVRGRK
jgi:hypothetical protein